MNQKEGEVMLGVRRAGGGAGRSDGGFTLLEGMVVVAILAGVTLAAFALLFAGTREAETDIPDAELTSVALTTIDTIARELRSAGNVSVSSDGSSITFQAPVEAGAGGVVSGTAIRWGAKFGLIEQAGASITYAFVPNTAPGGGEEQLSEAALRVNLNVNTELSPDTSDTYVMGGLRRSACGRQLMLGGTWIAQVGAAGSRGGDVDGDGQGDPIFAYSATDKTVTVTLWYLRIAGSDRVPILKRFRAVARLMNM